MRAGLWVVTLQAEFNDLQKTLAERAGRPAIHQSPEEKPRTHCAKLHGLVHGVDDGRMVAEDGLIGTSTARRIASRLSLFTQSPLSFSLDVPR